MKVLALLAAALLPAAGALADQSVLHMPFGDPARSDREVELRLDGITDTATGEIIAPGDLASRLAGIGLLFIGENHTSQDFHDVQFRVIQELYRAGRDVLIGLEMFPHTQQASLDGWTGGFYTEQGFVELAQWYTYWGYRWEYYRDIFLYAREHGIRMFGINTPRDVVKSVRSKGFEDLTPEEAEHFLYDVLPPTDDYRDMFKAFFDPEDALHMTGPALDNMLHAQTTWDATMGWNALRALEEDGGDDSIMVVLIGAGHVTYGLGSERQTAPHYDGGIASIVPVEIVDDDGEPVETVRASYANFVWGLPRPLDTLYPTVGVSLMGKLGDRPTQIIQVSEDSVAERAGLAVGDVLLSIDGRPVDSVEALRHLFAPYRWGDVIVVRIERRGKEQDLVIPLRRKAAD
jgi:uncharacterized iron-regulated protein